MLIRKALSRMTMVAALGLALPLVTLSQSVVLLDEYGRWVNGISEPWMFPESIPKQDVTATQLELVQARFATVTNPTCN